MTPDDAAGRAGATSTAPVFLDTNLFVYAAGGPHEAKDHRLKALQSAARRIVLALGEGRLRGVTSLVVLQEVLYLFNRWAIDRAHPGLRDTGVELLLDILALVEEVFPIGLLEFERALQAFDPHREDFNDRLILEGMRTHDVRQILTADRRFPHEEGFQVLDPVIWAGALGASE